MAHLSALGLVLVSPGGDSMRAPAVIDVELMGLPQPAAPAPAAPARPAAAAPRAEPKAEPIPPPPPPPPKPDAIVLPEQPTQAPKPKPEPREPEREVFREPEKKEPEQEKSLDELVAEMRGDQSREDLLAELRQAEPGAEAAETAQAPAPAASGGGGSSLTAEEREWHRRVRQHMKGRWILPAGFRTQVLQTIVSVRLDRAGNILGDPDIVQRSGNPWYDDSVMRGLGKASPLPPPPEAGDWQLVFRPEDSF